MKRKQWFCLDCRIDMKYDTKFDFFRCPICGAEAHFPQDDRPKDEVTKLMADMAPTHRQTEVKPMGAIVPGGGSKNNVDYRTKTNCVRQRVPDAI